MAEFPLTFPSTFGDTGPEQISASQFVSGASTNSVSSAFKEPIDATLTTVAGTANTGTTSISQPATTVSTAATMETGVTAFTEPITATQVASVASVDGGSITLLSEPATQFGALADSNVGSLSSYNLSALSADVSATENSTEVEGIVNIRAPQTTVSASQNDTVSSLSLNSSPFTANALTATGDTLELFEAAQVSTPATMNTLDAKFGTFLDAAQFSIGATSNSADTLDILFAVPYGASAEMNDVDVEPFVFLRTNQFGVNSRMNSTALRRLVFQSFGESNTSTITPTQNDAEIRTTVNEIE